jgi:hypothetical protein
MQSAAPSSIHAPVSPEETERWFNVYGGYERPHDADEWLRIWTYCARSYADIDVPQGDFVQWKSAYDDDTIEEETAYECPICQCTSSEGEMFTTACGHTFHNTCMVKWARKKKNLGYTCPMCRTDLF